MTGRLLTRDLLGALVALHPPQGQPVRLARPIPLNVWQALFARGWLAQEGDSVWTTKAGRRAIAAARGDIGSATGTARGGRLRQRTPSKETP